jgi:hypothetical protein
VNAVEDRYKELHALGRILAARDRKTIQQIVESKLKDLQSLQQQARILQSEGFFLPADVISGLTAITQAFVIAAETLAHTGKLDFFSEWPEQSELRSRYRYTLRAGTTEYDRHQALRNAVQGMGLYPVVNHVAAFASLHMATPKMKDAVESWREDLEWLKQQYYQVQFPWPGDG